jgi:hypothetical protein
MKSPYWELVPLKVYLHAIDIFIYKNILAIYPGQTAGSSKPNKMKIYGYKNISKDLIASQYFLGD